MTGSTAPKSERQKYIDDLNKQLDNAVAGQNFEKTKAGGLITKILQNDVNQFTKDVLSDKYINDHNGYLDARAKAHYAASLLNRIMALKNTDQKPIREALKEAETDPGAWHGLR